MIKEELIKIKLKERNPYLLTCQECDYILEILEEHMDKFEKLEKIEKILSKNPGFTEEEKAYNYMMMVIDCKEVINEKA